MASFLVVAFGPLAFPSVLSIGHLMSKVLLPVIAVLAVTLGVLAVDASRPRMAWRFSGMNVWRWLRTVCLLLLVSSCTGLPTASNTATSTPTATPQARSEVIDTPIPATAIPVPPRLIPTPPPTPTLAEVIAGAKLSVVRISTKGSIGSGIIIDEEGYVLTNYHVVEGFGVVGVRLNDGKLLSGTVTGTDEERDLAIVKVEAPGLTPLKTGSSSKLEVGDEVVAIGYPLDLQGQVTATRGMLSARRSDSTTGMVYLQVDAAINPGSSGGALINRQGELVGINTLVIRSTRSRITVEGIGFAISIDDAKPVAKALISQPVSIAKAPQVVSTKTPVPGLASPAPKPTAPTAVPTQAPPAATPTPPASDAIIRTLTGHNSAVMTLAFSPDGSTLASGGFAYDNTIRMWRTSDGALLRTLEGHTDRISRVTFSPDGQLLASSSGDWSVGLWKVSDGSPVRKLKGFSRYVEDVAFSPNGQFLVTAIPGNPVLFWRVSDGQTFLDIPHPGGAQSLDLSPDGQTLAVGSAGSGILRLYKTADGSLLRTLTGHSDSILRVAYSSDGKTLASVSSEYGKNDYGIRVWRVSDGVLLRTLRGHTGPVRDVAFSPDGQTLASASADGTVRLWRIADGTPTLTFIGHTGNVVSVAFSPGGQLLASGGGGDKAIRLWRLP